MSFKPSGFLLTLFLLLVPAAAPAFAETKEAPLPSVVLRTGEHAAYDRIVFDAPAGMSHSLEREGEQVKVAFSAPARFVLKQPSLKRAKSFRILSGADGKTSLSIGFSVSKDAKIESFKNERSFVFDVKGPAFEAPPAASRPEKGGQEETAPATTEKKPAAKEEKQPVVPEKRVEAAIAPAPQAAPLEKVEPAPVTAEPALQSSWPPRIQNPMPADMISAIRSIADEVEAKPVVVLDPGIVVGAAIYERAGYVTILFDRMLTPDAFAGLKQARVPLEPFALQRHAGFRIRVPDHISVRATREGTAWKIFLVNDFEKALLSSELIAQPDFALGGRLLLPTPNPPESVMMVDPVVGDELLVVPLQETGAFSVKRRLTEFQIVPSVQGLVIKPWHDRVTARVVPDGIEITSEGGLKLSPRRDTGIFDPKGDKDERDQKKLFDFKLWSGTDGEDFATRSQKLWQTIMDVGDNERVLARLDLARFYFAKGMGYEAVAMLDLIRQSLPEIERHPDFLALRGASRVLTGHVDDGLADLSHPSIKEQPEIMLWRAVGSALLQRWEEALPYFKSAMPFLEGYPEPMRSRFWILAIETTAALSEKETMVAWLGEIEEKGFAPSAAPAIHYLRGVLHSQAGRADLAEKLWKEVAAGPDRLYKIRAELALVDLGVATGSLTAKQAADRLEGLRFAWRGDGLEFDILKRLGGFYLENKEFREGFTTLFQLLRLFPDVPQSQGVRAGMVKTFEDIYLTDLGRSLSPLEALSLYTDFGILIPKGPDGNRVRSNLAERLVAIDLLDQAVKLLQDMWTHSETPKDKVDVSTRMAGIRLLDHKAEEALRSLDQSKDELMKLPEESREEWYLLRARALSEQGKYDEALAGLPEKETKAIWLLRADMAMRAKKWEDAVGALMALVGPPPKPEGAFSEEQAGWLVHAAMAMAYAQDTAGLDRLAIDYGRAMRDTGKAHLFEVITRPEKTGQFKDLQAAQKRLKEVDIFRGVLDSYRKRREK